MKGTAALALLMLASCGATSGADPVPQQTGEFPKADRPVATIVSSRWSTEEDRDNADEARQVMDQAGIESGMSVADIGAGEGYYTIRLSTRVGAKGRVLAQDIVPEYRDTLAERVYRERLDNVSVQLGLPADPKLPPDSFDRILLIHMYHEIASPYEFLWRMRGSLRKGGRVVIVDADRPTSNHGTPPKLLECELKAVGYEQVAFRTMPSAGGYLAMFEARGVAPAPAAIKPCKG